MRKRLHPPAKIPEPGLSAGAPSALPWPTVGALMLTMVASQAAAIVLSPLLVEVAEEFDVSIGVAGQLRAVGGATAGIGGLLVGWFAGRLGPRGLLTLALVWLAVSAGLSAISPTFAVLALAQALLGFAIALTQAGAVSGAALWIRRDAQARALSWILPGTAIAWIIGMPLVGLVGEASWRLAFVAVPIGAAIPALIAVRRLRRLPPEKRALRGELRELMRDGTVRRWAFGELCAFSAAAGSVVYMGALMIESYGTSPTGVGLVFALAMLVYLPGTLVFRRWIESSPRLLLIGLGVSGAIVVALLGAVRESLALTAGLLVVFMFVNAGRTMTGSSFGLGAARPRSITVMGLRTSAIQGGYLLGAGIGGLALELGGYTALGLAFAGLFLLSTVPYLLGLGVEAPTHVDGVRSTE